MTERYDMKQFDANHLLNDLRNYKERTPEIPWVDWSLVAQLEAQGDREMEDEANAKEVL